MSREASGEAAGRLGEEKVGVTAGIVTKNLNTTHPTTKLRPLRYGPLRVTEVISPVAYRLELPHQWKVHNAFHASLLSPYKETTVHGPNFPGQIPVIIQGQEEWEGEKVLD